MTMATEDPTYPIYRIDAKWMEDAPDGGRQPNSTGMERMFREDPGVDGVTAWAHEEWWPQYAALAVATVVPEMHTLAERNPTDVEITVAFTRRESWCLRWFQHMTFDVGQSDAEALASFERYVRRYEHMQDYSPSVGPPEGYVCLMGAEDRWRWSADGGASPPCRCEHCRKRGIIMIDH